MPRYAKQTIKIDEDWSTRASRMRFEAESLPEGVDRVEALRKAAMMQEAADMKLALGPRR